MPCIQRRGSGNCRFCADVGTDPRELEREQAEAKAAAALTVGEAWSRYIAERRPHWGERTYADHLKKTHEGGKARKRMPGVKTKPGHLRDPQSPNCRTASSQPDNSASWQPFITIVCWSEPAAQAGSTAKG